ncbi:MAG: CHAT domain-containing protein, partial [Deltaproteobacteria bacterium]|nr:CHAT domain-containing protein [Deltaproteobacteria bacterium]
MGKLLSKTCRIVLLSMWFLFAVGCAGIIDYLPSPPESMSRIELNGPYDKDIPEKYVGQLRGASMVSDWAIPYIFMAVGLHFESAGDAERALHFLDRSIAESHKRKDLFGEGTATNRKVFVLHEFGRIHEAFNLIKEKEKEWIRPPMSAFVYHNYGHYFLMNGDYGKASDFFTKALIANPDYQEDFNLLMLRRDASLELGISVILADYVPKMSKKYSLLEFDPAMMNTIRKRVDEGTAHLHQVLELNKKIRRTKVGRFTPDVVFQMMECNVYNFLGLAGGIKGNWEESQKHLAMSSKIAGNTGYRIGEIDSIFFLNQVYLLERNVTEGHKAAERFNLMADRYRFPFYQIWAKYILSRYHIGFGDTSKAINILREAVAVIEKQRATLVTDMLKETYLYNRQVVYESLVELLAREGDYRGALEMAERAKSRILVDLLAGKDISRNPVEATLLGEEEQANGNIANIRKQMLRSSSEAAVRGLTEKLEKAEETYRDVVLKIKKENEELHSMVSVQSTDIADIQNLLDQHTTLFDYFVTDKLLYVWAVQKERVHLERISISKEELRELVSSFLAAVILKDKKKTNLLSQKIYDVTLKPIIPFVSGDRIGFIPHDSLYYLPFAAMSYKGQFLVDAFSIFYLPNAGVFKYAMKKPVSRGMKVLAFGNPDLGDRDMDLPYAAMEVESIKKRIDQTTIFLNKGATKKKVKDLMGEFDIIHFATHGQYIPDSPMASSLLLTPDSQDDGRLTALEILKLHFKGRAVVLSACKTALGMSSTGTEIVGFNRSFLYAGSPSVISTLWNVDDKATAQFMDHFYKYLEAGKDMADALKMAKADMIRKGYPPYYWAPFILTGRY